MFNFGNTGRKIQLINAFERMLVLHDHGSYFILYLIFTCLYRYDFAKLTDLSRGLY